MKKREQQSDPLEFLQLLAGMQKVMGGNIPTPVEANRMEQGNQELALRQQAQELDQQYRQYQMDPNNPENALKAFDLQRGQLLAPLVESKMGIENTANQLGNVEKFNQIAPGLYPTQGMVPGVANEQMLRMLDEAFRLSGRGGELPSGVMGRNQGLVGEEFNKQNERK